MARLKQETASTNVETDVQDTQNLKSLQKEVERLSKMIEATGDVNKVRDFNRRTSQPQNFCYSMGLWETEDGDKVITSWRMTKDYVADKGNIEDQRMELTLEYDKKIEIKYEDFYRMLKRTKKIEATKIFDDE